MGDTNLTTNDQRDTLRTYTDEEGIMHVQKPAPEAKQFTWSAAAREKAAEARKAESGGEGEGAPTKGGRDAIEALGQLKSEHVKYGPESGKKIPVIHKGSGIEIGHVAVQKLGFGGEGYFASHEHAQSPHRGYSTIAKAGQALLAAHNKWVAQAGGPRIPQGS
jgi:hypothetical protein